MDTKAQAAFDAVLKQGRWKEGDVSNEHFWFSPSAQRLWQESGDVIEDAKAIGQYPDAVRVTKSGCPKCLVGYTNIMADPMFNCELCHGTGFPVFNA